ncbi:hypothetical protein [Spirosoma endbachense]|uniref:hypothetical protein n=1 Tax=Spirosoma endbachense TaxID=2666025 RepID=UPI001E393BDA|nr:hypothetical protein [Spirosoma endbachense]
MISTFTKYIGVALIGTVLIGSCSRPVAYFQKSPNKIYAAAPPITVSVETPAESVSAQKESLVQATSVITQLDTYVRNDNKLAANKNLNRRMARIKTLLASTSGKPDLKTTHAPSLKNGLQKLIQKKMNRRIGKQLAAAHPDKALVNGGKLIGGIVLLVAGLLLLILGSGTVAFIGLIVSLVGALGVIVGLFGIDS